MLICKYIIHIVVVLFKQNFVGLKAHFKYSNLTLTVPYLKP